jgi:hypothetical protein
MASESKAQKSEAKKAGIMELADEEAVFEMHGDPEHSRSMRTVLAGVALSLGFIAGGIWLARGWRRKLGVSLMIALASCVAIAWIVAFPPFFVSKDSDAPPVKLRKVSVSVTIVSEHGPAIIMIPKNLKPTWVGPQDVLENWGSRPPRPSLPDRDK